MKPLYKNLRHPFIASGLCWFKVTDKSMFSNNFGSLAIGDYAITNVDPIWGMDEHTNAAETVKFLDTLKMGKYYIFSFNLSDTGTKLSDILGEISGINSENGEITITFRHRNKSKFPNLTFPISDVYCIHKVVRIQNG